MSGIWYATVEQVLSGLEVTSRARATTLVKQKLENASRSVEDQLNRRFYPERRIVKVDWPNYGYTPPWAIDIAIPLLYLFGAPTLLQVDRT